MKIDDIDFYEDGKLEQITVLTCSPQTNCSWLVQNLCDRNENSQIIELGVTAPVIRPHKTTKLLILKSVELPILANKVKSTEFFNEIMALSSTYKLVLCLTLSESLLNNYYATGSELARLSVQLIYKANLIIQLQPLKTGRARDITGRLIVAKGPKAAAKVLENEFFYFVGVRGQVDIKTVE